LLKDINIVWSNARPLNWSAEGYCRIR